MLPRVTRPAPRTGTGSTARPVPTLATGGTGPKFWGQHAHAGQAWGREFLAHYCALPGAWLELRSGAAADHVVEVAGAE